MPIIQMPGSVGGAGDAVAPITAQNNQYISQLLQLMQLQEHRRARAAELAFRERAFAAELGRSDRAFEYGVGRDERQEARALRNDERTFDLAQKDDAFRERAFAQETELKLEDQEQRARLTDVRIAAQEAETGAFVANRAMTEGTMARQVARSLPGEYAIDGFGIRDMFRDVAKLDPEKAREMDALFDRLTKGQYEGMDPEVGWAKLSKDPRLPLIYAELGTALHGLYQADRAKDRAADITRTVSKLSSRVSALGNKQLEEEFALSMNLLLPGEDSDDATFLNYADGDFKEDAEAWTKRIGLEENKADFNARLDERMGKVKNWSAVAGAAADDELASLGFGAKGKSVGEIVRTARADMMGAETALEAQRAFTIALVAMDPDARLAHEFGMRQGIASMGGAPQGVPAAKQFSNPDTMSDDELDVFYQAMGEMGLPEMPEPGSDEERKLVEIIDRIWNSPKDRARRLHLQPPTSTAEQSAARSGF